MNFAGAQRIEVLLFGTSWNFIFLNNFDPTLAEPMDAKTKDTEGKLVTNNQDGEVSNYSGECSLKVFLSVISEYSFVNHIRGAFRILYNDSI